ncbi:MAG: acyl carrier protein [Clostridiales bacterium]
MVFDKIKNIIADKLDIDPEIISLNTSFKDLQVDSLYLVEIMMAIEEEFDIVIEDAEEVETVGDMVAYTESKLS